MHFSKSDGLGKVVRKRCWVRTLCRQVCIFLLIAFCLLCEGHNFYAASKRNATCETIRLQPTSRNESNWKLFHGSLLPSGIHNYLAYDLSLVLLLSSSPLFPLRWMHRPIQQHLLMILRFLAPETNKSLKFTIT